MGSFIPVSKETWINQVVNDLRGKSLDELNFNFINDEYLSPFWHREDKLDIILPSSLYDQRLGMSIFIDDVKTNNKIIIDGLNQGVSYLELTAINDQKIEWGSLLSGVLLDLVVVRVTLMSDVQTTGLEKFIQRSFNKKTVDVIVNQLPEQTGFTEVSIDPKYLIDDLSRMVSQAEKSLELKEQEFHVTLHLVDDYFKNIATLRAIRLLWENLLIALDQVEQRLRLRLKVTLSKDGMDKNINQNMIALTQMCTSAMSGGAEVFIVPPSSYGTDHKVEDWHRRISWNIYNLLRLESHVDKVEDPAAGSYAIDNMTAIIARQVWDKVSK